MSDKEPSKTDYIEYSFPPAKENKQTKSNVSSLKEIVDVKDIAMGQTFDSREEALYAIGKYNNSVSRSFRTHKKNDPFKKDKNDPGGSDDENVTRRLTSNTYLAAYCPQHGCTFRIGVQKERKTKRVTSPKWIVDVFCVHSCGSDIVKSQRRTKNPFTAKRMASLMTNGLSYVPKMKVLEDKAKEFTSSVLSTAFVSRVRHEIRQKLVGGTPADLIGRIAELRKCPTSPRIRFFLLTNEKLTNTPPPPPPRKRG